MGNGGTINGGVSNENRVEVGRGCVVNYNSGQNYNVMERKEKELNKRIQDQTTDMLSEYKSTASSEHKVQR